MSNSLFAADSIHKRHGGTSGKVRVGPMHKSEKKTRVVVEKNGDTVTAIRITCRCGEETLINCSYPETG